MNGDYKQTSMATLWKLDHVGKKEALASPIVMGTESIQNGIPESKAQKQKPRKKTWGGAGMTESHNLHVANFVECIKTRNQTYLSNRAGRIAAFAMPHYSHNRSATIWWRKN